MTRWGCRGLGRLAVGLWLAAPMATTLVPSSAKADEPAASDSSAVALSEQRAAEAFAAYSKKDYAAAVALYQQAYEAAPSGSILYNIARIYDTKLADRPLAITFYRRYIADPGAYTERIEFANQRLKQLREAENLTEKLADSDASSRKAEASERERAPHQPSARAGQQSTKQGEPGWSTLRWSGVVTGLVGVAALGTGAAFGLSAMSKAGTASEFCDGNACTSERGVNAARSADDAATISNIGFLAGGGLLALGTTLFFLGGAGPGERARSGDVHFDVHASRAAATLEISGRW